MATLMAIRHNTIYDAKTFAEDPLEIHPKDSNDESYFPGESVNTASAISKNDTSNNNNYSSIFSEISSYTTDPVIHPKLHFQIAFWFYCISNCNPFWYKCLYTFHIIFKFCVQKNIFVALNNDVKFSGSLLPAVSERVYCAWKVPLAEPVNKYLFLWEKANFQYLSAHSFLRSLSKTVKFAGFNNDIKVSGRLLSSVCKGACSAWKVALAEPANQYLLQWKKQPVDVC